MYIFKCIGRYFSTKYYREVFEIISQSTTVSLPRGRLSTKKEICTTSSEEYRVVVLYQTDLVKSVPVCQFLKCNDAEPVNKCTIDTISILYDQDSPYNEWR